MENVFTSNIKAILKRHFGDSSDDVFEKSLLIQYINEKTRSANRGSKSRSSFANLYAIYVIIEDYLVNAYDQLGDYSKYEGALFSKLFARQRELPFGNKLQNHALNNRMNSEFEKFFPKSGLVPIIRDHESNRYWINENLLRVKVGNVDFNIGSTIIEIIDEYVKTKQDSFQRFVKTCEELQDIGKTAPSTIEEFVLGLLAPSVDARLFEIVSYSILRYFYHDKEIYWGYEVDKLNKEQLVLYKTGRTNANDGGIDFVMKPLGRLFQVTETLDFKKYFLDIDKLQKYPITFVVKSNEPTNELIQKIRENAMKAYPINTIVERYMACIEEVINIPVLADCFKYAINKGYLDRILHEIIIQSKVEFNYDEAVDTEDV
ncbi:MAG: hypothetical protein ACK5OP_01360 [Sphingobacteriales bacterium]|jgi:hypothetical protein